MGVGRSILALVIAVIAIVALLLWARGVRIRDVLENPTPPPSAIVLELAA